MANTKQVLFSIGVLIVGMFMGFNFSTRSKSEHTAKLENEGGDTGAHKQALEKKLQAYQTQVDTLNRQLRDAKEQIRKLSNAKAGPISESLKAAFDIDSSGGDLDAEEAAAAQLIADAGITIAADAVTALKAFNILIAGDSFDGNEPTIIKKSVVLYASTDGGTSLDKTEAEALLGVGQAYNVDGSPELEDDEEQAFMKLIDLPVIVLKDATDELADFIKLVAGDDFDDQELKVITDGVKIFAGDTKLDEDEAQGLLGTAQAYNVDDDSELEDLEEKAFLVLLGKSVTVHKEATDELADYNKLVAGPDWDSDMVEAKVVADSAYFYASGDGNTELSEDEAKAMLGVAQAYNANNDAELDDTEEKAMMLLVTKGVRVAFDATDELVDIIKFMAGPTFEDPEPESIAKAAKLFAKAGGVLDEDEAQDLLAAVKKADADSSGPPLDPAELEAFMGKLAGLDDGDGVFSDAEYAAMKTAFGI